MKKFVISVITIVCIITSVAIPSFAATYKLQFFIDPSFRTKYGGSSSSLADAAREANYVVEDAISFYENNWNVEMSGFTYQDIGQSSTSTSWLYWPILNNVLPMDSCSLPYYDECTSVCASTCVNDLYATENHHKNGFKNWLPFLYCDGQLTNADIVILFTATNLCYRRNNVHKASLGGLYADDHIMVRHNAALNPEVPSSRRALQHEIGHHFGLLDATGCNGPCIMREMYYDNDDFDSLTVWCSNCRQVLNNAFNN